MGTNLLHTRPTLEGASCCMASSRIVEDRWLNVACTCLGAANARTRMPGRAWREACQDAHGAAHASTCILQPRRMRTLINVHPPKSPETFSAAQVLSSTHWS
eukprot:355816-Chlamydomonas_euryale.AAC.8